MIVVNSKIATKALTKSNSKKDSETILNSSEIGLDDSLISTKAPSCVFDKLSLRELRAD